MNDALSATSNAPDTHAPFTAATTGLPLDEIFLAQEVADRELSRERVFQVLARGLVFPREVAAQPDIGKTVGARLQAAGLGDAALEGVAKA